MSVVVFFPSKCSLHSLKPFSYLNAPLHLTTSLPQVAVDVFRQWDPEQWLSGVSVIAAHCRILFFFPWQCSFLLIVCLDCFRLGSPCVRATNITVTQMLMTGGGWPLRLDAVFMPNSSYQRSTAAFCVQITSVPWRSLTINSQTCLLLQVLGQMLQAAWPSLGCVLPPAGRTACTARLGAWREVGWVVEWAWAQFGLQKQTNSKRFCIRKLLWYLWTRGSAEIAILCKKLPLILKSGGRIKAGAVWYSACWSTWIWICDLRTTQFRLDSAVALLGVARRA